MTQKLFGKLNDIERASINSRGIERVQEYCKAGGADIIGAVNILDKKSGKDVKAYLVMRKIDIDGNYKKMESPSLLGKIFINEVHIHSMVKNAKKGNESLLGWLLGAPKGHSTATKNSYALEIIDDYGLPIGIQCVDVTKNGVTAKKGLINLESSHYGKVGTILNDAKSLIAQANGSKTVHMASSDKAKGFHMKTGFVLDESRKPSGMGDWMHMPEENLNKIVENYKDTEVQEGFQKAFG